MTRQIKFRTYGTFAGVTKIQEVYPCGLDSEGNQLVLWNGTIFTVDNLMQFTGLLDKNGKEIYEGDIVYHVEDVTQEIIGGYPRTEPEGIFTEVKIPEFYIKIGDELPDADELEIIGDIYTTPDLIK